MNQNGQPWKVEAIEAQDLRPGDLFSEASVFYWKHNAIGVGEKVYIRTTEPCPPSEVGQLITRITITAQPATEPVMRCPTPGDNWECRSICDTHGLRFQPVESVE